MVDWQARIDGTAGVVRADDLYPPTEPLGAAEGTKSSPTGVAISICAGASTASPGFVQVRDRRSGELSRLTIDEPENIEAVERAAGGSAGPGDRG